MVNSQPKDIARFSIIVTCYNQREFIGPALESALSQQGARNEIIVVDDGSTDGSCEVLESYAESIQIVMFRRNRGAIPARNHGASLAGGEYLVFLDGDDVLMPWALHVYNQIIVDRHPTVILARAIWFSGLIPQRTIRDVPRNMEFVEYESLLRKDRAVGLSASTYVVARHAFWAVGGWSEGIFHLDLQDLSAKLGCSGPTILICSPATALYRIHELNSIHDATPFLTMARRLMDKERAGLYPGGIKHRFERRAWLGGLVFFWIKRAMRAGLYNSALDLLVSGWLMIAAAIGRRSFCLL
jgi:glycosyltransferase involved in cell wall biosynthesis